MSRLARAAALATLVCLSVLALPASAAAHGPSNPVASKYLAKVTGVPAGLEAKAIDGDQRLWLRSPATATVVVLDPRGAPYLRFSRRGVEVNQSSEMYYLNQTPVAEPPPPGLTRATAPRWALVSGAHEYVWHDGRLHALAAVAISNGQAYVGQWSVPVLVGSRATAVSGGLWHRGAPSIVWFWPILVLVLCLLAARRLRRPGLDAVLARGLALATLAAIAVASAGRQLHGRPHVSAFGVVELAVVLAFATWALWRVAGGRAGFMTYFVIAFAALWEGVTLLGTLVDGFVLMALPAFVARAATVVCLGAGGGLLLLAFRLAERPDRVPARVQSGALALMASALAGCGSQLTPAPSAALPADLVAGARPIGRAARFHPPATGPVAGRCVSRLGQRVGVHVEVFAADRVVLIPAGIGSRPPRRLVAGRIARARCFGDLVTLEPTGVVLVRAGARRTLGDLFRAWGQPLTRSAVAGFAASPGRSVAVFVGGRLRPGPPQDVPLTRHAEIVLEVGPHVPPHASYTFPPGA